MHLKGLSALLLCVRVVFGETSLADDLPPVPRLQTQIEDFQSRQKPGALSEAEREIMRKAAEDLASTMPSPGLPVDSKAPDFILSNANGETIRLHKLLESGPVILTFYRGAWCPYCNLQLRALRDSIPHFQQYQAQLVAVTPQTPDRSQKQVQQDQYPFEILSDLEDNVTRAYNLYFEVPESLRTLYEQKFDLDISEYNGEGRYGLPIPGTFVIDEEGVIRAAFADTDYKKRMEPGDIIKALADLEKPTVDE